MAEPKRGYTSREVAALAVQVARSTRASSRGKAGRAIERIQQEACDREQVEDRRRAEAEQKRRQAKAERRARRWV